MSQARLSAYLTPRVFTLALCVLLTWATAGFAEEGEAPPGRWSISGDLRLRYEHNSSDGTIPAWDRGSLRARLVAGYRLSDEFSLGGRVATGDPDNPRTTDTDTDTLGSDFHVKLDRAFLAFNRNALFLTGGRFATPFSITEMTWDTDANAQGVGGHYDIFQDKGWSARVSSLYFAMDSDIYEHGSDMLGGQFSLSLSPRADWDVSLHAAYYDYGLKALRPTAPGGARGNHLQPGTLTYLSDFDLLDTLATATYSGFGDRWPVKLQGNYVKNLGAAVEEDEGYTFDVFAGTLERPGRVTLRYGYAQAGTDAVLGIFSNDNIVYATNYEMHTFSVDVALWGPTHLGLTHYLYRRLDPELVPEGDTGWVTRTRLMFNVTF